MKRFLFTLTTLFLIVPQLLSVALGQTSPAIVVLRWNAVTAMADGSVLPKDTVVTYNIYSGRSLTGPWALTGSSISTGSTRANVKPGANCYYVVAVVNGKPSAPAGLACVTVTQPVTTGSSSNPAAPISFSAKVE